MAIISAIAAAASAAEAGYQMSRGSPSSPTLPTLPTLPAVSPTASTTEALKAALPTAKADTTAQLGGGVSPQLLAGITGRQAGVSGGGLDILDQIRQTLGGGVQGP